MQRSFARSRRALVALFLAVGLGTLTLLAYFSITIASDAVRDRARENVRSSAALAALYVREELRGLETLGTSFAARPLFVRALGSTDGGVNKRSFVRWTLEQLYRMHPGIGTVFVADANGRLIDIVPPTPSIVGDDFSYRDWYRGVTSTGRPYVSEAYVSRAAGRPKVVAVATPVVAAGPGRERKRVAILVAAYRLRAVNAFVERFSDPETVAFGVTDQRGAVLADSTEDGRGGLVSRSSDPGVAAALAGRSGTLESDGYLEAFAPVPDVGWTVTARLPTSLAFSDVEDLRRAVALISMLLALVLVAGAALLARILRDRDLAENELRALLDANVDATRLVDAEGHTLVANRASQKLAEVLRMPVEGTIYERWRAIADATTDPAAFLAALDDLTEHPERELVDEFELKDSGRVFHRYTAPVRDSAGRLLGRVFIQREVTAEREAERLKSELVATVSHELRTPLTGILGFAELARRPALDDETRGRYLDTVVSEAARLSGLVNDFLDLQRIETADFKLALERFDLGALLEEQVRLASPRAPDHTIELELPEGDLQLAGDRERIGQVVANLLSNAIKYSPSGGEVAVRVEKVGSSVRVLVRDEGVGIPEAQQSQIFRKFFRVDSSDTRKIGGTGLGLALAREIVEAHGGRMGFGSVEGEGSTFWFELPAGTPARDRHHPRALVIEDDEGAAELLAAWLSQDGYDVETATGGDDGVRRAIKRPPDVVCLDIGLPGAVDGWQVLARLKANSATAHVPVVVCTGNNGRHRAAALGAADFLAKPFSAELLRETIARVVPPLRGRVLVVDDEETVRRLVIETLSGTGLELEEAADGEEALAAIAERPPNAIVLDLMMPGIDGFAVLERLHGDERTRTIPVVVLTAKRLSGEERARMRARAVNLLEKSAYSADDLRRLVDRAIGEGERATA